MDLFSLWMVVVGSLSLITQRCCYANECVFQYTQQPPSFLCCNPYNSTASPPQLQLILACGAQRNDSKQNEWTFDLRWFSNYSGNALSDAIDHVIDVRTPSFNNQTLLVLSPGQYWCQVLDYTDGSEGHLLARSNVVEVLSWERYSFLPVCIGNQSVMENKCADLSPSPSVSPAISNSPVCPILMKEFLASSINESSLTSPYSRSRPTSSEFALSQTSDVLGSVSQWDIIHTSTSLDYPAVLTPSISTSSVSKESSTNAIILVLVGVMLPLLVLLLLLITGIKIALFLRQKAKSKAELITGPLQEQATSRHYVEIHLERHGDDGSFPQSVKYEQPISLQVSSCPQTTTMANPCDLLYSEVTKNKVCKMKDEHLRTLEESSLEGIPYSSQYDAVTDSGMPSAPLSSNDPTYSYLQNVQASCDVNNGGHESQYSKLSHIKEVQTNTSQNQVLLAESYGHKMESYVFDDPQYAVSSQYDIVTDLGMPTAPPPSNDPLYSYLQDANNSCDAKNGGDEPQYSKLSHQK